MVALVASVASVASVALVEVMIGDRSERCFPHQGESFVPALIVWHVGRRVPDPVSGSAAAVTVLDIL